MASKARRGNRTEAPAPSTQTVAADWLQRIASGRAVWIFFALAALIFYAAPLFETRASVQWDAADYHYSAQKYFADQIHAGKLPLWTPYPFAGMPFLADPQVGAWYPLNWPFFLLGITPRSVEWELALHCLLACLGAFLLARALLGDAVAALCAGVLYGFCGFLAAHSSHVGMFQTAALLPWLLWAGLAALRSWRWLPVTAVVAACVILAGHFQTALYALTAYAIFLVAHAIMTRAPAVRVAVVIAATVVAAAALTAVQTLPGLELTSQSVRASMDFSSGSNAMLQPGALMTLVNPDAYHAPGVDNYSGPSDITQFYFYQGFLLLPLAALGAAKSRARWYALALAVPALWYALGPAAGLYQLVALLPGYRSVRAPVHVWFVVALGLAVLAAGGVVWLRQRFAYRWLAVALLPIICGDLWYWNMGNNGLAYARATFGERYGDAEQRFQLAAAQAAGKPPNRYHATQDSPAFGPLNGMLDTRTEVTYGYNPLQLSRYTDYVDAARENPKLLDSLAVTARLNSGAGAFEANATALPRVTAPASVVAAASREEAARKLVTLDPARQAIVENVAGSPTGPVTLRLQGYEGDVYRVAYQAAQPALLRIATPYFPGWRAEVNGRALPVVPVDLALSGVVVPAGSGELVFRYESTWFALGAWVSAISWLAMAAWIVWSYRRTETAA